MNRRTMTALLGGLLLCSGRAALAAPGGQQVVRIELRALGQDAAEIEQRLAIPLERALTPLDGVARMHSRCADGLLLIELHFTGGAGVAERDRLRQHLAQISLADGVLGSQVSVELAAAVLG